MIDNFDGLYPGVLFFKETNSLIHWIYSNFKWYGQKQQKTEELELYSHASVQ